MKQYQVMRVREYGYTTYNELVKEVGDIEYLGKETLPNVISRFTSPQWWQTKDGSIIIEASDDLSSDMHHYVKFHFIGKDVY